MKDKAQLLPESREHKIKVRLQVLNISQSDFAKAYSMAPQQFGHLVRSDYRDVRQKTLENLSEMLNVPVEFLTDLETWEGLFSPAPKVIEDLRS